MCVREVETERERERERERWVEIVDRKAFSNKKEFMNSH